MNENIEKYIEIGKIVNTFGIKGELKVTSDSDFIDYRFAVGKEIYLKYGKKFLVKTIKSYRILKGNVIIMFEGTNDINDVTAFIGVSLYALKNDRPPLHEGKYLVDDLVGLDVFLEDGTLYGKVSDIIKLPANDVIEIHLPNGETKLIPFIGDFIVSVDEKLVIRLLEEIQ